MTQNLFVPPLIPTSWVRGWGFSLTLALYPYIFPDLNKFTTTDWLVAKEEGKHFVLRCMPPDSFPDGTVNWSRVDPTAPGGKMPLPHSSHYTLSSNDDLHFAHLRTSDAGDYSCTVTNSLLAQHVTRTISVSVSKGMLPYPCTNVFIGRKITSSHLAL